VETTPELSQQKFAQDVVSILVTVSPQLANYVDEWIPPGGRVCMLMLLGRSLCLLQVYTTNSNALHNGFREKISDALRRVKTDESTILLGDFIAHVVNDVGVWRV